MKKLFLISIAIFGFSESFSQHIKNYSDSGSHKKIEVEQEIYPIDLIDPYSKIIKVENLTDLYRVHNAGIFGLRSFVDVNYHTQGDTFNDIVMYTQTYAGRHWYAIGAEIGSIAKHEYLSFGPQLVFYDWKIFERFSVNSRIFPKYIVGMEYTTIEFFKIKDHLGISSTGMLRYIVQTGELVCQASLWFRPKGFKDLTLGCEYEFNNRRSSDNQSELFLGIKYVFSK